MVTRSRVFLPTLIFGCFSLLNAADITVAMPVPAFTAVAQPAQGRVVTLELGTGDELQVIAPMADVHLWKGHDDSLGDRDGLVLRDAAWSVALLRWEITKASGPASISIPLGGFERPGGGRLSVHRMLVPWSEAAGWADSGQGAWSESSSSGPKKNRHYEAEPIATLEIDEQSAKSVVRLAGLDALVAGWADGSIANNGILLRFDGPGLQVSVPARERLTGGKSAILSQSAALEVRWNPDVLSRVLLNDQDLHDLSLDLEIAVPASDEAGGHLDATTFDGVAIAQWPVTSTGVQRVSLNGLASTLSSGFRLTWSGAEPITVNLADKPDHRPAASATIEHHQATNLFPEAIPFRDGVYVRSENGHLRYGDERLRLWGTIGYGSKHRIRAMGFNAYRFWGPNTQTGTTPAQSAEYGKRGELPPTTKGDNSGLDQFDRGYAECRELGLWVMATFLMRNWIPGSDEPGSFVDNGGDFSAWHDAVNEKDWGGKKIAKYAAMVDERFALIHEQACSQILNRVNPYTGKRYAEDEIIAIHELANEEKVVKSLLEGAFLKLPDFFRERFNQAWIIWLRTRYADDAALLAAWGAVDEGESLQTGIQITPLFANRDAYAKTRAADVVRFFCETHRAYLNRIRSHCRSLAPEGVGINVTPFSYDTQYRPNTPWTYVGSAGDVQTFGMYFWNYESDLTAPPSMYVMDSTTVAGKPTVIYETNRGRPSPYRSEYPYMLAAFASWQDWDALFFHYWGGPGDPVNDEQYLLGTLNNGNIDHFWTMVHHAQDPVMCAAIANAGRAFLSGAIPAATNPVTVEVGGDGIFGYDSYHGINQTVAAFQRGSRLLFSPDADFSVQTPADMPVEQPTAAIHAGAITWDWPNGRLIVDTPSAKFLVGRSANHTFGDGITISGFDVPWAAVSMVSSDGKPLAHGCERALISATAQAQNTDFAIDLTAQLGGPIEQIKARRDNGKAPVIVERVGITIGFPSAIHGTATLYDFARRACGSIPVASDGAVRLHGQDYFLAALAITSHGTAQAAVVDPLRFDATAKAITSSRPNRRGYWSPISGLNWDTTNVAAVSLIAKQGQTAHLEGEHVVIDRGELFLPLPAKITLNYAWARLAGIRVEPITPPTWDEAEAALKAQFGPANERKLGTQFEGSRAAWKLDRDGGTFLLELTETQGVMRIALTPPGAE